MHHNRFATVHLHRLRLLITVCALIFVVNSPVWASDALINIFEVKRVSVDVSAESVGKARAQALADGQKRAFQVLLERLTLQIDHPRLPSLNPHNIDVYVRDFGVSDEKTSPVRYIASMTVRFNPRPVRELLRELGVQFAETPSKPVVVVPVYQVAGATLLWDDPNPWLGAWNKRGETYGLVPMIMPIGDLGDIGAIGSEQAIDGDQQRLSALAKRYGASDTVVAHAIQGVDVATARPSLEVYVTRYGTELVEQTVARSYVADVGEDTQALLTRAAMDITRLVEDNWKRDNLLNFGAPSVLAVTVPIGGLQDWLAVKARLERVAVVREANLVLLGRTSARVTLHYIGDVDQLALALEQADLSLREQEGGVDWFLYLARS